MTELSKSSPNIFENITSIEYFSKQIHANLPKIKLSTQEADREVRMIEAKVTKNYDVKKLSLKTTPKRLVTSSNKVERISKSPYQRRMNLKLQVNPHNTKIDNYENENLLSDVNCNYQLNGMSLNK